MSTQTLMPLICDLWDKLYVPLVYRSRFFMHFRGQKPIYLEMEHRRLEWRYSKVRCLCVPYGHRAASVDMRSHASQDRQCQTVAMRSAECRVYQNRTWCTKRHDPADY